MLAPASAGPVVENMRLTTDIRPALRISMLACGFAALALGTGAGLARMGWQFPLPRADLAAWHGALMVSGFFGTLISLERAVALSERWAYAAPLAGALGVIFSLAIPVPQLAAGLAALASLIFVCASTAIFLRQRALSTLTLVLGAVSWLAGNALWLFAGSIPAATPWWIGFLVLTIAGERLELSRLLPPSPRAKMLFGAIVAVFFVAQALTLVARDAGWTLLAATLLTLSLWLARQDVARRTVREHGLTRFIALCLLSGYAWLAMGAIALLVGGTAYGSATWDTGLHAVMLGFVFSMVFGHAPIIFPAVTRAAVPYHRSFYLPLALLHISLALRIAGSLGGMADWRQAGGAANALALLLFVLSTISAVVRGKLAVRRDAGRIG
jgi:hypothetical protein